MSVTGRRPVPGTDFTRVRCIPPAGDLFVRLLNGDQDESVTRRRTKVRSVDWTDSERKGFS